MDLGGLFDAVVFNLVIGNNDAHGKNFALTHREEGTTRLVLRRAVELMKLAFAAISKIDKPHAVSERVAALVEDRIQAFLLRFRGG